MITRLLFVDSNAEALARIKDAIEQAGNYEAKVFVTGQAALEYASQYEPTVAVVSLNVQDIPPSTLVNKLRELHPGLLVLLRAPTETPEQILKTFNSEGILTGEYTARTLLPLVEDLLESGQPVPDPPAAPPATDLSQQPGGLTEGLTEFGEILESLEPDAQPSREEDSFDVLVESMRQTEDKSLLLQRRERMANWADLDDEELDLSVAPPDPADDKLFQKLAAEEPPMPALEDSGTVRDLIAVTDFSDQIEASVVDIPDDMIEDVMDINPDTAELALLDALAAVSSDDEPANPINQSQSDLIPIPKEVAHQLVNNELADLDVEPAAEPAPTPADHVPVEPVAQTTPAADNPASLAIELTQQTLASSAQASILVRNEHVEAIAGGIPDEEAAQLVTMLDFADMRASGTTKIKFVSLPEAHINYMVVATPTVEDMVLLTVFPENMHLRIIRQQTKIILGALVASIEQETQDPEDVLDIPLPPPEESGSHTGVHQTPQPDDGEELFAAAVEATEELYGHTGAVTAKLAEPVSDSSDNAEGVQTDVRESTETTPELDPATLVKYGCAWILRDPHMTLDKPLADDLPTWISQIALANHWLIDHVDVQAQYISVVLSIAPSETPSLVVQTLMAEVADKILETRPEIKIQTPRIDDEPQLWADAYYVIAPGRPPTPLEVDRFISYQREVH